MPGKSHLTDTHLFFQKEAVSVNDMDALFNAYEDFLFVLDCNGDILHTNRIVTEKLGYSFDELQNRSVLFLHPSERHEEVGHIIKRMFEGKELPGETGRATNVLLVSAEMLMKEERLKRSYVKVKCTIVH